MSLKRKVDQVEPSTEQDAKKAKHEDPSEDAEEGFETVALPETTEIDLGYRTLKFLGTLSDNEIVEALKHKMRDIVANITEFQYRFAKPMDLPFELGRDRDEVLEMPRPLDVLLRYGVAFSIDSPPIGLDDGLTVDGQHYALAGHFSWQKLVKDGKVKGNDAIAPHISTVDWLADLFLVLELAKNLSAERQAAARRLAACWFYVCTQMDIDDGDEFDQPAESNEQMAVDLMTSLGDIVSRLGGDDDEGDFAPDDDFEGDEEGEYEDDVEMKDEEDEDIYGDDDKKDAAAESKEKAKVPEAVEELSNEDMLFEDELGPRVISEKEKALQAVVFRVLESLGCYMPDPKTDLEFFKRVLKHVRVAQASDDFSWYPWGAPPIKKIVETLQTTTDEDVKQIAANIILLFQQNLQPSDYNSAQ